MFKKYNEAEQIALEMLNVMIGLVIINMLGLVLPGLGWFLEQDIVFMVEITTYLGYVVCRFIDMIGAMKKLGVKTLFGEEDR